MSVLRLGYLHMRVTDLADAKKHYVDTLGMLVVDESPGRLILKAWDEWDHHSLVLTENGVGVEKLGYKVSSVDELARYEKRIQAFGCTTDRMSAGDNPGVGDGVRVTIPSGHVVEFYHDIEFTDTAVGLINPEVFPRHLMGIGVPRIDHCLLKTDDIPLSERFWAEALEFNVAERLVTDLSDDAQLLGTWMFCQHKTHDIAFVSGENGRIHHFAYKLQDWNAIR